MVRTLFVAAFFLFRDAPRGPRKTWPEPLRVLGIDSSLVSALLICDPYADSAWRGEPLSTLRRDLETRVAQTVDSVRRIVCEKMRRSNVEPWMEVLVATNLAAEPFHSDLVALAELARQADRDGLVLYYSGD